MNYKQIFVTSLSFFFWCKPEFAILTYVILLLLLLQNMVSQALETAVQESCVMPSLSLHILFILIQLSHKMVYVKSHQYNMVSPIHSVGRREMERIVLLPP